MLRSDLADDASSSSSDDDPFASGEGEAAADAAAESAADFEQLVELQQALKQMAPEASVGKPAVTDLPIDTEYEAMMLAGSASAAL